MTGPDAPTSSRRAVLAGAGAACVAALSGCTAYNANNGGLAGAPPAQNSPAASAGSSGAGAGTTQSRSHSGAASAREPSAAARSPAAATGPDLARAGICRRNAHFCVEFGGMTGGWPPAAPTPNSSARAACPARCGSPVTRTGDDARACIAMCWEYDQAGRMTCRTVSTRW